MLYFISDITDNRVGLVRSWSEDEFTLFGRHKIDFEKDNNGFFVDKIPDKEDREEFTAALMFDGENLWWEYTHNPMPPETIDVDQMLLDQDFRLSMLEINM